MRDTWELIEALVLRAGSLEEAISLVDEEMEKGDCIPFRKEHRDAYIRILWKDRVKAQEFHQSSSVQSR